MIFTKFNVLTFFILLIINAVLIYSSHKRRKFAYFSSRIFTLIFASYWIMLLIYFQSFDFTSAGSKRISNEKKKPKEESTYVIKENYENETSAKLVTLSRILTVASIQALLVVLLSGFGIIWLNEKVDYYTKMIIIHILLFGFCLFILYTGVMRNGYENIMP